LQQRAAVGQRWKHACDRSSHKLLAGDAGTGFLPVLWREYFPAHNRIVVCALTINVHIKSVTESQVNAMDVVSARLEKEANNNLATGSQRLVN
jgi:hypothetical protein